MMRRRRLGVLIVVCWSLLIPSSLAWLVNLELALRLFFPGVRFLEPMIPWFALFAADFSTISTLVPVLLFLFPLVMAHRLRRMGAGAGEHVQRLIFDPYPPHFPFFLVMLGLTGTLYGLLIGLDVSGVRELSGEVPSADTIRETLDRLLDGTATALLSSLLGLAGAFLAARPLTWLFHRAAMLPPQDDPPSLSATLQALIDDLQTLGSSTRSFSERLDGTDWRDMPASLSAIRDDLAVWRREAASTVDRLDALADAQRAGHDLLQPLARLDKLDRLDDLERHLAALAATSIENRDLHRRQVELVEQDLSRREAAEKAAAESLEGIRLGVEAIRSRLDALEQGMNEGREAMAGIHRAVDAAARQAEHHAAAAADQRDAMVRELHAGSRDREADRTALRRAFGQFLQGENRDSRGDDHTPARS